MSRETQRREALGARPPRARPRYTAPYRGHTFDLARRAPVDDATVGGRAARNRAIDVRTDRGARRASSKPGDRSDGSVVLDESGSPIATYDQSDVSELARVFTGWTENDQLARQDALFADLSPALKAFYDATVALGVGAEVTTSRCPTSRGRSSPPPAAARTTRGGATSSSSAAR